MFPDLLRNKTVNPRETWDAVLARLNVAQHSEFKEIGHGSMGHAFLFPKENKVLKISEDFSEANAMVLVMKNPCSAIVSVHDVFRLRARKGYPPLFFIYQDFLSKKIKKHWKDFINLLSIEIEGDRNYINQGLFDKVCLNERYFKNKNHKEHFAWLQTFCTFLDQNRIKFKDLHEGNVLASNNDTGIAAIDIGYCKCEKQKIDFLKI